MGFTAKDLVTGFSGQITGHARYITGCDSYLLQPEVKEDGEFVKGLWFDDDRLEIDLSVGSAFLAKVEERKTEEVKAEQPKADKRVGGPRSNPAPVK